jgi:hypothetical protein
MDGPVQGRSQEAQSFPVAPQVLQMGLDGVRIVRGGTQGRVVAAQLEPLLPEFPERGRDVGVHTPS